MPSRSSHTRLLAAALLAAAAAPSVPAPSLAAQGVLSLTHRKVVLDNGLEVILHEDPSVPIVAVNTWYKVGSGDEEPGRTGFAHLFEHVMFMGSQHVPVGKFDEWLEAAGASNNGSTNTDRTNYYEIGPSNALPLMLWLDADRMGFLLPTMDQAKLDVQRDVVKNERRQRVDNVPYGRVNETITPVLFGDGHPYSWPVIGSMADLSAASLEDVTRFFRVFYAPNNASIAIAGDIDADSAIAEVRRFFADLPRGEIAPRRPTVPTARLARDSVLVLEDRVQLPRVYYAWRTTAAFSADDAALEALAEILAGGRSSRLYRTLVYEGQQAQDVGAYQNGARLDGSFWLFGTARPGVAPRVLAEAFDAEIARIAREGVTEREVAQVRNGARAQLLDRVASVLGKADLLNYYNYYTGTPDYLAQDLARYEALTPAAVQAAARRWLNAPKVVLTVVPEGKTDLALTGGAR